MEIHGEISMENVLILHGVPWRIFHGTPWNSMEVFHTGLEVLRTNRKS